MPIEIVHRYSRAMLKARPDDLFVFGDNMLRQGLGGQAAECRGEPNAVGVPTKHKPSWDSDAFFSDADFTHVKPVIDAECRKLARHLRQGGTVVLPADGIGTGRAKLSEKAPRIRRYLDRIMGRLHEIAREMEAHPRETPPGPG